MWCYYFVKHTYPEPRFGNDRGLSPVLLEPTDKVGLPEVLLVHCAVVIVKNIVVIVVIHDIVTLFSGIVTPSCPASKPTGLLRSSKNSGGGELVT